jgi:hypothetical protein
MNTLLAIAPYKFEGFWVFDDPRVGLRQEPFISGADRVLDILTAEIPDAAQGFKLVFSAQPFPGFVARFVRSRPEFGGYWYSWPERGLEGWLCPALFKYFETAPDEIYVKVFPKDSTASYAR